jgi:glucose/arabinose dehydrogenase
MRARTLLAVAIALVVTACADDTTSTTSTTVPAASTTSTTPAPTTTGGSTSSTIATTTTTLPPPPLDDFELDVELVADGFEQPVLVTSRPGDDRLFVVEQGGRIIAMDVDGDSRTTFLDIDERVRWNGEQGLLGLAFHPGDGDRLVVHYTAEDGSTIVEEYSVVDGVGDPESRRRIFATGQPASNHNGGMIDFGPDGFLYVALGDGGAADDRFDNGQNPFTPLGAILRLDLSADPYAIPADNPFADGEAGAPEVWAWGLRNPWRFAFDGTDLWVGDVGQGAWEEIDLFSADRPGDNAGWPSLEGTHCFRVANCDPSEFLGPVFEYGHLSGRCSVTGGAVYRGTAIPELVGTYLYGDYCTGEVWGLRLDPIDDRLFTDPDDVHLPRLGGLTSFGVGPDGELYVMQASGQIWRFVRSG